MTKKELYSDHGYRWSDTNEKQINISTTSKTNIFDEAFTYYRTFNSKFPFLLREIFFYIGFQISLPFRGI